MGMPQQIRGIAMYLRNYLRSTNSALTMLYQKAYNYSNRVTGFGGSNVMVWGGFSLHWKTKLQPVAKSPQSGTKLHPLTIFAPREWVYQRDLSDYLQNLGGRGLPPVLSLTTMNTCEITLGCCLCQRDQHNHTGRLVTNAGWGMGCHSTAVCDKAGDQYEGEGARQIYLYSTFSCTRQLKVLYINIKRHYIKNKEH